MKLFNIFIIIILFSTNVCAQHFKSTAYRGERGPANTFTKAVAIDSLGFAWVASDDGFYRFNGINFDVYKQNLKSNYCKWLINTRNYGLIGVTDNEVAAIHSRIDTAWLTTIVHGGDKYTDSTILYPKQVYESSDGALWISSYYFVSRFDGKQLKHYNFPEGNRTTSFYRSFALTDDGVGNLLAFSETGNAFRFDALIDSFVAAPQLQKYIGNVNTAVSGQKGQVLIGTREGLFEIWLDKDCKVLSSNVLINNINVNQVGFFSPNKIIVATATSGAYLLSLKENGNVWTKIPNFPTELTTNLTISANGDCWFTSDDGVFLLQPTFFEPYFGNVQRTYIQIVREVEPGNVQVTYGSKTYQINVPMQTAIDFYDCKKGNMLHVIKYREGYAYCTTEGDIVYIKNGKEEQKVNLFSGGRTPFFLNADKQNNIWVSQDGVNGVVKITPDFNVKQYVAQQGISSRAFVSVTDKNGLVYVLSEHDTSYLFRYDGNKDRFVNISPKLPFDTKGSFNTNDALFDAQGMMYIATNSGLLRYNGTTIERINLEDHTDIGIKALSIDKNGNVVVGTDKGILIRRNNDLIHIKEKQGLATSNISYRGIAVDSDNRIWAATSVGLSWAINDVEPPVTPTPIINSVLFNNNKVFDKNEIISNSYVQFKFFSLAFPAEDVIYQYRIVEHDSTWLPSLNKTELLIPKLNRGKNTIQIRAKIDGNYLWSHPVEYHFVVIPAWYQRWWAWLGFFIVLTGIVWFIVRYYTRRLVRQKQRLEKLVNERTQQIQQANQKLTEQAQSLISANTEITNQNHLLENQKVEIEQKNTALELQKNALEKQNDYITKQNQKIEGSIRYATNIQSAILPLKTSISQYFDAFIVYRPKDIVSGDFYWFAEVENNGQNIVFLSVIDCTGHGVPGAIMSMLGYSLLNEIVKQRNIWEPGNILEELDKGIKKALQQETSDNNDGMDVCLCRFEKSGEKTDVVFSGAKNGIYYFAQHEGKLTYLNGDRKSIGGYRARNETAFEQAQITLYKGDIVYLMSDGLVDQNNHERKRFGSANIKSLLEVCTSLNIEQQQNMIEQTLNAFMKGEDQRDDITIIGAKVL